MSEPGHPRSTVAVAVAAAGLLASCQYLPAPTDPVPPDPSSVSNSPAVSITAIYPSPPDPAGGIAANVDFVNTSGEVLGAVSFMVTPFDAGGELAPSGIRGETTVWLRSTGPYPPGRGNAAGEDAARGTNWKSVWINPAIRCVRLDGVQVDFANGWRRRFGSDELPDLLAPGVRNACAG